MKFFNVILLYALFSYRLAYAIDFKLYPSSQSGDVNYFSLQITNAKKVRNIDIALEGNANNVKDEQSYTFSCQWGKAFGIRLRMDSSSSDGVLLFDNIYFFDNDLNLIFAKSYSSANKDWADPFNLANAVCNRGSNGLKVDPITRREYIVDYEAIEQGPYVLRGVKDVSVKYIRSDLLTFIREDKNGEMIIDVIDNYHNMAPAVCTLFFMKLNLKMNIITLVSWGAGRDRRYKVYGYTYDESGNIFVNKELDEDINLSGYDNEQHAFKYKNANSIKQYVIKKYSR